MQRRTGNVHGGRVTRSPGPYHPRVAGLVCTIDQGTTGTRCLLLDEAGRVVAERYATHRQSHPSPGLVEHDAEEIWARTEEVVAAALLDAPDAEIVAVGIANQRETSCSGSVRRGGRSRRPSSGRTRAPRTSAGRWRTPGTRRCCASGRGSWSRRTSRRPSSPGCSTTSTAPARAPRPASSRRARSTPGCSARLTGRHATDATNASRTLLAGLDTLAWDDELCELLRVPRAILPEIAPSWSPDAYGTVRGGPLAGVPVTGVLGDQQAALLGQACIDAGDAKCTYGTGSFLLAVAGERPVRSGAGLLASPARLAADGQAAYCLEGSIAVTGRAIGWLVDELGVLASPRESAEVAASVPDTGGVQVVPAFQGLYAPWWDGSARGTIVGLTLHSTRAHVVRATLESIAYLTRAVVGALEADVGVALEALRVDGGMTANDLLMQLQADILGRPVVRSRVRETTALGAAFAAGLGAGVWSSPADLRALVHPDRTFEPAWSADRREEGWATWQRAVERARGWEA